MSEYFESLIHGGIDAMYSEEPPICANCDEYIREGDEQLPHACAELMPAIAWVCSDYCKEQWCEYNEDEIEEYEYFNENNRNISIA